MNNSQNTQTEFDSPWKDIIQQYFEEFILFFFPPVHREINWNRGFEFLDQELQKVVRDAELGKRLVDKLVKVYKSDGAEAWVLIHIEIQSQEESDFSERMFVYNYRIYDRYRRSVASLAVLGDERNNWRPNKFGYQLFGCEVNFQFPVVKLLDYSQQWAELETNRNPFATIVMAHLLTLQTRNDKIQRKQSKLALTKRLYEFGFERKDIINLFRFIDWIMSLPLELEQEFEQELHQYEEEKRMQYITSIERMGIQKGKQEGLVKGISLGLKLKFGEQGLAVLPEISSIENINILEAVLEGLETVNTIEELRQIYRSQASD
ncbi:MAG TPA: cytosolic protein [Nostocaceae cyanobacterium]|nr:cytosolic protein [Nostocaceae cyanobacterium]